MNVTCNSQTQQLFVMLFYCLGQHVTTITGPSSGYSETQILKLKMIKMHCRIPNAYVLDTAMYIRESRNKTTNKLRKYNQCNVGTTTATNPSI